MAVGFMLLYTKLSNVLSKEALFYTVIVPFIAFFRAFGFLSYPLSGVIHPTSLARQAFGRTRSELPWAGGDTEDLELLPLLCDG
ncbi:hypothetical protein QJS10_CPB13g00436 [Acorus calamus]|uniref:ADP,ATP carrier protein n=1 Tax=Acorus calamus TaxID=4465 RepID=A0AAV9DHP6_ACOCL|nr:hypothetical protein QJS10_CPB13g00436 [Acorus calamus]